MVSADLLGAEFPLLLVPLGGSQDTICIYILPSRYCGDVGDWRNAFAGLLSGRRPYAGNADWPADPSASAGIYSLSLPKETVYGAAGLRRQGLGHFYWHDAALLPAVGPDDELPSQSSAAPRRYARRIPASAADALQLRHNFCRSLRTVSILPLAAERAQPPRAEAFLRGAAGKPEEHTPAKTRYESPYHHTQRPPGPGGK